MQFQDKTTGEQYVTLQGPRVEGGFPNTDFLTSDGQIYSLFLSLLSGADGSYTEEADVNDGYWIVQPYRNSAEVLEGKPTSWDPADEAFVISSFNAMRILKGLLVESENYTSVFNASG